MNANPATLLCGWARVGRCQQDTKPVILQNWPAGSRLLALWPALQLHPMCDSTQHKALSATPHSVSDGGRQSSVPVAFLLFDQIGGCGQWGHFRNMSFPCLLTVVGGIRTSQKQIGKTKIPVSRRAKELEYEILQPLRWEGSFSGNLWDHSFCKKIGRQRETEAGKCSKGSWLFVLLVALQIKCGKYQMLHALAEACFSLCERK